MERKGSYKRSLTFSRAELQLTTKMNETIKAQMDVINEAIKKAHEATFEVNGKSIKEQLDNLKIC